MFTSILRSTVALAAVSSSLGAQVEGLGVIDFPNSGAVEAQEPFLRGVLLLHSFEYDDAAESFRRAQRVDSDFALAYWGEAMTHSHPVWHQLDAEGALEVLEKLAATPEERAAKAPTEREKGLLACAEVLFGEGERAEKSRAYEAALAELRGRFPDDLEILAFHSLAILGTVEHGRHVPTYMRAAAVAEEVYRRNPEHPGGLHYAIHSYDDPVHAPLGLRMARTYARVAPNAEHALHMPSHIYVALGMWEESAASNEASSRAADERRERRRLGVEERGYHSLWWLCYSYLQLGRVDEARELLEAMELDAEESGSKRTRSHLARMRSLFVVATDGWRDEALEIQVDLADLGLSTSSADRLVLGMAAAKRSDLEAAEAILAEMREQRALVASGELSDTDDATCCQTPALTDFGALSPGRQAAVVMERELEGVILLARGETEAGLERLREATDDEDAMSYDFGPPVVVKPAHELLGEVLLELERAEEAEEHFEAALRRAPNRTRSVRGLERAVAAQRL